MKSIVFINIQKKKPVSLKFFIGHIFSHGRADGMLAIAGFVIAPVAEHQIVVVVCGPFVSGVNARACPKGKRGAEEKRLPEKMAAGE